MRYFYLAVFIFIGCQCFSQTRKIEYKDWDGRESKLVAYKKVDNELILTIIRPEQNDTVNIVFSPITTETEKLYNHIVSFSHADESYVLKAEEQGYKFFYTKFKASYHLDKSIQATYYDYFFEEKMFPGKE